MCRLALHQYLEGWEAEIPGKVQAYQKEERKDDIVYAGCFTFAPSHVHSTPPGSQSAYLSKDITKILKDNNGDDNQFSLRKKYGFDIHGGVQDEEGYSTLS